MSSACSRWANRPSLVDAAFIRFADKSPPFFSLQHVGIMESQVDTMLGRLDELVAVLHRVREV